MENNRSDKRGCGYSLKVLVHGMGTIEEFEWGKWVGIKENEISIQIIATCRIMTRQVLFLT